MENLLKRHWAARRPTALSWLMIPSAFAAETMAKVGWDALIVDLQHGLQDYASMVACFQAMQPYPVTRLVRIPANEPGIVGRALDAGAHGIVCPMVNTGEEAEAFVRACKYPPRGSRSNGPIRAAMLTPGPRSYQASANDETLAIAMIETAEGVRNIDDILAVEGIDSVLVGPTDLGYSMGLPPILDRREPEILDAYRTVLDRCAEAGVAAGIHVASAAYAREMWRMGFLWTSTGADSGFIAEAASGALLALRRAADGAGSPESPGD